eukprot:TRINITY_DN5395_c0_g2_i1.p2 TRINITY_DN5395_c0_g2~~TRINITY_DN5395_c0_g2_i1.p2  ORF type:complete len:150 (-),score=45.65 TRINITY_DN5395_c0_g2_i1:480-929(-)
MDKQDDYQQQLEDEFLDALEDYTPTVPEEVTDYYLKRAGFASSDPRMTKLVSLATQKFISEIVSDAYTQCSLRQQNPTTRRKDKRMVLTMEDLSTTVSGYGIHLNKPPYHAAKPGVVKDKKTNTTATITTPTPTVGRGRGRKTSAGDGP